MVDYTYDDFFLFKKFNDTANEHNNNFIFNKIPDFYITSLSKLMYDIFE